MAVHVLDAMVRDGFEELVALHDRSSGLRAFLAIHDTSRGPAFGGLRRFAYRDEKSALMDCLRLAKAMSMKCALAGVNGGGAKLVLFDHPGLDRAAAYRSIGRSIERLAGRYYAGPDVGTGTAELSNVAFETKYVTHPGPAGPGDLPGATAAGVFAGMRAALVHLDGEEAWEDRTVVIQGLGSVGQRLAVRLIGLGARVSGVDLDEATCDRARGLGVEILESGSELDKAADIFCPCAMGGLLHDLTIQRIAARAVCGAANNPLARSHHAERLHARGILYVPDFVINSGAVIRGAGFHLDGRATPLDEIEARIGEVTTDVLRKAAEEAIPPFVLAKRVAEQRIRVARNAADSERQSALGAGDAPRERATAGDELTTESTSS